MHSAVDMRSNISSTSPWPAAAMRTMNADLNARYMPLTSVRGFRRCRSQSPRSMPHPTITGFFGAMPRCVRCPLQKRAQASASKRKQAQAVPWDVGLWARDAVRGEPSNGRRIQTGDQTVKFRPVCALFMQSCDSLYGLLSWRWLRAEPRPFSLENRSDRRLRERTTPEVSCC